MRHKLLSWEEKCKRKTGWVFAWFPRFTIDGYFVWLEPVWREAFYNLEASYGNRMYYEYYGGRHV